MYEATLVIEHPGWQGCCRDGDVNLTDGLSCMLGCGTQSVYQVAFSVHDANVGVGGVRLVQSLRHATTFSTFCESTATTDAAKHAASISLRIWQVACVKTAGR